MAITDKRIYNDNYVSLEPVKHIYTDLDGNKYQSVSRLLDIIDVPFDADAISRAMAVGKVGKGAAPEVIKKVQNSILKEWDDKRNNSATYGTAIHQGLEDYFERGSSGREDIDSLGRELFSILRAQSHRHISEKIYYDSELLIAGSADLSVIRKEGRTNPWILDIFDYKTNIEQGIRFDSIDRRKVPPKHYEKYYVGAFSMIESCNYYKYCMQISIYAYMAMKLYNVRIGRLAIIFIDSSLDYKIIPVPFMYYEVEALLKMKSKMKQLPVLKNVSYNGSVEERGYEVVNIYEDSDFEPDLNN